ncbi:MAG: hypothetical protein NVS4B3_14380 [Gemmatimonadaceae bacterium]
MTVGKPPGLDKLPARGHRDISRALAAHPLSVNLALTIKERFTMNYTFVFALLFGMFHPVVSSESSRLIGAPATSTEEIIRRLNADEVKALLHNDAKALALLFSDELVVTNPFNKFLTKSQVLGMVGDGMLGFSAYDRQVDYVHVYGTTAVVAGGETVTWAGKMPVAGQISQLRFTAVWMRQKGRWQQVARHASMVVPRASAGGGE